MNTKTNTRSSGTFRSTKWELESPNNNQPGELCFSFVSTYTGREYIEYLKSSFGHSLPPINASTDYLSMDVEHPVKVQNEKKVTRNQFSFGNSDTEMNKATRITPHLQVEDELRLVELTYEIFG